LLDQGKVVKVASHPGDTLPDGVQIPDCGFAYRTTKKGTLPITLNVNKSLWRDSAAFFQSRSDGETCPRIINWQINLEENTDLIPKTLKIQVLGLEADQASPVHWVSERFSASIEFLSNRDLWEKLCEAIKVAEDHQKVFYPSYASLAKILEYDKPSSLAKALDGESRYWATLDRAFPFLLDALPQDTRTEADGITRYGYEELPKWTKTVQNAARDAFTASIESIRNYKARAAALRTLEWQLRKLRGEDKDAKGSGKTKKKTAA
jgi:CRISPR system Cascade subunit CasA